MEFGKNKKFIVVSAIILLGVFFIFAVNHQNIYKMIASLSGSLNGDNNLDSSVVILPKTLANSPFVIKAVYITGWSAGSKKYLTYLDGLFKTTQINAVVIDIKDYSGVVSYKTAAPKVQQYGTYYPEISDIDSLIGHLHSQGIYVIGRIVSFEDSALAKARPDLAVYDTSKTPINLETQKISAPVLWGNNDGLYWLDPASNEVQDYDISIAKDAINHGFDEINFDYVQVSF